MPLTSAICQILYTFCKVRGEKVIVRFFNAETRNLELLLSAVEGAERFAIPDPRAWTWEERYVSLLWLSHLLLAPFDLVTISSAGAADFMKPEIPGLVLPDSLPSVTLRVIALAVKYLSSPGKERDAAKALLVRISVRRDMQELGLLHALIQWALSCLHSSTVIGGNSVYYSAGILSYLAGVLASSTSVSAMDRYLVQIFRSVHNLSNEDFPAFKTTYSSALVRKTVIKVLRTVTILALGHKNWSSQYEFETNEITETTIGLLLESLADNDTPVRLAASKALSVITLKLAPDMATQVINALLESLTQNVLWVDNVGQKRGKTRDLSAVNSLEWHGLILTLSHLLYRCSPRAATLPDILNALLIGLSFEQRSSTGSSLGTNVRDAACFGIWALARRYTTAELRSVDTSSVIVAKQHDLSSSIIQILATELVVCGSLDPAGNIRRGASAALQELIGRHPDTVTQGISVVQVVDYHAVALRSRAVLEVAPKAALLSRDYEEALLNGLLGWRGLGDRDPTSRRTAAAGIGLLVKGFQLHNAKSSWNKVKALMKDINEQLNYTKSREIDQRHGLLLSMAAVIASLSNYMDKQNMLLAIDGSSGIRSTMNETFQLGTAILQVAQSSTERRADLISEGASRIVHATVPILRSDLILQALSIPFSESALNLSDRQRLLDSLDHQSLGYQGSAADSNSTINYLEICHMQGCFPQPDIVALAKHLLDDALQRGETEVIAAATDAAKDLMLVVGSKRRSQWVREWISQASKNTGGCVTIGIFFALANIFAIVEASQQKQICDLVLQWWQTTTKVEVRVILLQTLTHGSLLESHTSHFVEMIASGLDDYTTDGRGDIGSLVRIEALKAAGKALSSIPWARIEGKEDSAANWFGLLERSSFVYGKVLRLSAEKLDKVRLEAQRALIQVCRNEQ